MSLISMHCDSQSTIERTYNVMYNSKSQHIHRRYNTIRKLLSTSVITINYVKSNDNIDDSLTKALNRELVTKMAMGMGLNPME